MVSTSVCTVRISTAVSGLEALICLVASTPFITGMLMSMITMSGRCSPVMSTACLAVAGLADDLEVRLLLEDVAQGPADQGVIVHQQDADLRGCDSADSTSGASLPRFRPLGSRGLSPPSVSSYSRRAYCCKRTPEADWDATIYRDISYYKEN